MVGLLSTTAWWTKEAFLRRACVRLRDDFVARVVPPACVGGLYAEVYVGICVGVASEGVGQLDNENRISRGGIKARSCCVQVVDAWRSKFDIRSRSHNEVVTCQ